MATSVVLNGISFVAQCGQKFVRHEVESLPCTWVLGELLHSTLVALSDEYARLQLPPLTLRIGILPCSCTPPALQFQNKQDLLSSQIFFPPPTRAWEVKAQAHCNRYELQHDLHLLSLHVLWEMIIVMVVMRK